MLLKKLQEKNNVKNVKRQKANWVKYLQYNKGLNYLIHMGSYKLTRKNPHMNNGAKGIKKKIQRKENINNFEILKSIQFLS